jgi:membrane protein DedA with SNARE-associated domain
MSSGFSKVPFKKFVLFDFLACTFWSTLFFFTIYKLGSNFDSVLSHLKHLNIAIFSLFATAAIAGFLIWRRKKTKTPTT